MGGERRGLQSHPIKFIPEPIHFGGLILALVPVNSCRDVTKHNVRKLIQLTVQFPPIEHAGEGIGSSKEARSRGERVVE